MSHYEERIWPADPSAPGGRRNRQAFRYRAYVPDPIAEWDIQISGETAGALAEADRAVSDLNRDAPSAAALEALARQLLRQESLASSRIEGLQLSHRRLARADFDREAARDRRAVGVLGNIRAMERAIEIGASAKPFAVGDFTEPHRVLFAGTEHERIGGVVRETQNWLGGSWVNPHSAEFVPPPPEYVPPLLGDLAAFLNRAGLSPTLHAAIAHAQFETIHPFADGNGRIGRCLIHVVLRRAGLAPRYVPPVSLIMLADTDRYVKALTAYREDEWEDWVSYCALTVVEAVQAAERLAGEIAVLVERWSGQAGKPRKGSAAAHLIEHLAGNPVLDVKLAARIAGSSEEAARLAVNSLEEAGILRPVSSQRRNRTWEVPEVFNLINSFERDLATPPGAVRPARAAPRASAVEDAVIAEEVRGRTAREGKEGAGRELDEVARELGFTPEQNTQG